MFEYKIENIVVNPATAIAPMEGLTDAPFRAMIKKIGSCGLTVTEFVNCEALTRDVSRAWETLKVNHEEYPCAMQIYGRNPDSMARAAAMCEERGAPIVDLNFGCPAKKVVSGNAGSAIMKDPALASEILRKVRRAIRIPMTVKMRLGWSDEQINVCEIAKMAQEEGASQVVVHARTRAQNYGGKARWSMVKPVVDLLDIPVLVNGDILTPEHAVEALRQSGAQGVMVGRGLLRNPWLLRQIDDRLSGRDIYMPAIEERLDFVMRYIDNLSGMSESRILGKIKCFIGYFTRALANSSAMREAVYKRKDLEGVKEEIRKFFESLGDEKNQSIFNTLDLSEKDARVRSGDARDVDF